MADDNASAPGTPPTRALTDRVALVTGVSRSVGIGVAIARRLHRLGARVLATGWSDHDAEMPWGVDPVTDAPFPLDQTDLSDPDAPARLVDLAMQRFGALHIVVAAHARSSHRSLAEVDAAELDRCWTTNVRSVVLLAQQLALVHRPSPPGEPPVGRLIWFTSGQHHAPMDHEVAYAVSKGALHQMTSSIDHALAPSRIIANCVNPGPVDTGYATGPVHDRVATMFPDGRWGTPEDVADVVAFLLGDHGSWIRGQVIDVEGGFDRFTPIEP